MEFVRGFKRISKSDVSIAGGKGASLGEMLQTGIPVPPGFVILSSAFEHFLEETDLNVEIQAALNEVKVEEMHTIENASEKIKAMIVDKKVPEDIRKDIIINFNKLDSKFVAVRSSATSEDSASAAWAGQLETYLNTTKEDLLENVKRCWASLFTPRAIFYRFEQKLEKKKISVAVVVQKMVESEKSGISFSVHPVTQDKNQIIIEAGYGLGEAIVSGQITPDSYVIGKKEMNILDVNVNEQERGLFGKEGGGNEWKELGERGKKQVLSEEEILELSKIIVNIERHYRFPVDVEWAEEKGKFYIVQSRPITTLLKSPESKNERIILEKRYTRERGLFLNLIEHRSTYDSGKTICGIRNFIYPVEKGLTRYWYDLRELQQVVQSFIYKSNKEVYDNILKRFNYHWSLVYPYLSGEKDVRNVSELRKLAGDYFDFLNYEKIVYMAVETEQIPDWFRKESLALREKTQEYIDRMNNIVHDFLERNFKDFLEYSNYLTPEEVYALEEITSKQLAEIKMRKERGYIIFRGEVYPIDRLNEILEENNLELNRKINFEKLFTREHSLFYNAAWRENSLHTAKNLLGKSFNNIIIVQDKGITTFWYDSNELAENYSYLANKLKEKGFLRKFREHFEIYWDKVLPYFNKTKKIERIDELEAFYHNWLQLWSANLVVFVSPGLGVLSKEEEEDLFKIRSKVEKYNDVREDSFFDFFDKKFPEYSKIRDVLLPEEVFMLKEREFTKKEVEKFENRLTGVCLVGEDLILLKDLEQDLERRGFYLQKEEMKKEMRELKGQSASPGHARGKVRLLVYRKQIPDFRKGEILVTSMTSPDFVPAMKKAAAIVTDEGGITSHAAIVSRELRVPCVIGTKIATQVLKDGMEVEVDATNGSVKIIESEKTFFDLWLSRPYPLLQVEAYNHFLEDISREIDYPITRPIFLYKPEQKLVTLYYNMTELLPGIGKIGEKIMRDESFRRKIFSESLRVFELIKQYFDGDLSVGSMEEFEKFFWLFKDYMKYVGYTWVLPGLSFLPQEIRDEAMRLREKTEDYAGRRDSIMTDFADSIIKNKEVNPSFLSLDEIRNNKEDIERKSKERARGFLFYDGKIFAGDEIKEFLDEKNVVLREPEASSNSEFKGQTAQRGIVRGKVKIVYTEDQLSSVENGDVLVTPMTRPEFVPAMKKAAAIVTDEGGIVCHAAIVARELGKPCIIGAKVATKVLHDGDLAEVDADKGIVRILNRSSSQ